MSELSASFGNKLNSNLIIPDLRRKPRNILDKHDGGSESRHVEINLRRESYPRECVLEGTGKTTLQLFIFSSL